MVDDVMQRLAEMGIDFPVPPQPMGSYVPAIEAGSMLFVSMQGPLINGRPSHIGLLGRELSVEQGREAAKWAAINALAQIHRYLGGFARIRQIVRLEGYVACVDGFLSHPQVIDGASELLAVAFADRAAAQLAREKNISQQEAYRRIGADAGPWPQVTAVQCQALERRSRTAAN